MVRASAGNKAFWKSGLLLVCSALLSLTGVELAYRSYLTSRYKERIAPLEGGRWLLLPDSPLVYRMKPSSQGELGFAFDPTKRIPFRTNSDGFRDREVGPKDSATRRIFVIGDSYTFGYAVEEREAYPQVTGRLFKERGIMNIEVLNGGIPGYDTRQEAFLLEAYLPVYQPDMVVLGYVMNDAEPADNPPLSPRETYHHAYLWIFEDLKELLNNRIFGRRILQVRKIVPNNKHPLEAFQTQNLKWRDSRDALKKMVDLCRGNRVPLVVLIFPSFNFSFDDKYPYGIIHQTVRRWGADFGVPVVDLMDVFRGEDHREYWVPGDGHPNARAHQRAAQILADVLLKMLRGRSQGSPRADF